LNSELEENQTGVRTIAFYLPQFYPNPQNDEWWGKGFTEWTNVTKARPLFGGHYQPHLPTDLGFYDLRLPETREDQANLAREYGIEGFCYYHYWFHGERMLDRVFGEVLESGKPDFPFCLCWANESWTRTWAGIDGDILCEQRYSADDDLAHINFLISAFKDPRYIRVNGRPLFLVYRSPHIQDHLDDMLTIWSAELAKAGLPELYLCTVRTPPVGKFEATVDFFPPNTMDASLWKKFKYKFRKKFNPGSLYFRHQIVDYAKFVDSQIIKPRPDYRRFLCPVPNWDNSPRKATTWSTIMTNSSPAAFERWFDFCVRETLETFEGDERIVFINAWNEWAEGTHLEPDRKWGRGYLEAIQKTLGKLSRR